MNYFRTFFPLTLAAAVIAGTLPGNAAEIVKANNTTTLSGTGAWVGGVVPGSGDIAVWDSTLTVDRTNTIGGNLSFLGIKMTNPSGTNYSITNTAGSTLTIGASGIDLSNSTANLTVSATMVLNDAQTWTVAAGHSLTIGGSGAVNQGAAEISLQGSGTFTMGSNTAFGTGTLNLGNGITLAAQTVTSRVISNAVNLNGDITMAMTGSANSGIAFNGGLNVGSATRTINIVNPNGSATNNTVTFLGSGTAGGREIAGTGTLVFENGNAADSPMVSVRFGTSSTDYAAVRANVTLGSGVTAFFGSSNVFTADSALTLQSGAVFNMSNGGGAVANQTIKSLAGSGTVINNVANTSFALLTINGGTLTTSSTFSGVIQNGPTGGVAITKQGTTKQVLAGANTYTGQTQINAGTLLVNGTHIEAAAVSAQGYNSLTNGHYLVGSGATLGGAGRISGNNSQTNSNMVLVQSGGVIAPGDGVGTFVLDGLNMTGANNRVLNMASGADFAFELGGDGSTADQIEFWNYASTDLLLNNNEINLTLSGPLVAGTYTVTIFEFFGDSGTSLTTSGITSGLVIGTTGSGITGASIIYDSAGGTISLEYTVVPEPSVAVLSGLGLAMSLGLIRRRR